MAIIGGILNGIPRNTDTEIMTEHIAEKPIAAPKRIDFWLFTFSTFMDLNAIHTMINNIPDIMYR